MRLETARLVIRTFQEGDGEQWLAVVNDERVSRYSVPGPPLTLADFSEALKRRLALEGEHGIAMWAVDLKETGRFIGQCGIHLVEGVGPEIELTYHFGPSSWNNGYATEAVTAVLGYGFETRPIKRIEAYAFVENVGSWRVMEKAGMRYVGQVERHGIRDLKMYEADRSWWISP